MLAGKLSLSRLPLQAAYPRPTLAAALDLDADGRVDVEVRTGSISPWVRLVCTHLQPVAGTGLHGVGGTQILTVGANCIPDLHPKASGTAIEPGVHLESA